MKTAGRKSWLCCWR